MGVVDGFEESDWVLECLAGPAGSVEGLGWSQPLSWKNINSRGGLESALP